jgi:ABC-type transporter Mla MlaB component
MSIVLTEHPDRVHLLIEGALTVMDAAPIHAGLVQAVQTPLPLEVDLSQVSEIDCAGMQLLLSLKRTAPSACLTQPSEPLRETLRHFNLLPELGLEN